MDIAVAMDITAMPRVPVVMVVATAMAMPHLHLISAAVATVVVVSTEEAGSMVAEAAMAVVGTGKHK
jgi:hypothetical protein